MIQKILALIESKKEYSSVVPIERIIKSVLSLVILNDKFEITEVIEEKGKHLSVSVKTYSSVFAQYLFEQLDLYVQRDDYKIFIFGSVMGAYHLMIGELMKKEDIGTLLYFKTQKEIGLDDIKNTTKNILIKSLVDFQNRLEDDIE